MVDSVFLTLKKEGISLLTKDGSSTSESYGLDL